MNLESVKSGITQVAEKYGLSFVVLFGSQATGQTHAKSDVDIAYFPSAGFSFDDENKIIGDIAEVISREDIDLINLRKASPLLQKQVIDSAILLYEKEPGAFEDFVLSALRLYRDTLPLRQLERDYVLGKSQQYEVELSS